MVEPPAVGGLGITLARQPEPSALSAFLGPGLVFAVEAQPDNYKDSAKRMQLDSISPEASLMDIDTVDPYRSLYFSLCY